MYCVKEATKPAIFHHIGIFSTPLGIMGTLIEGNLESLGTILAGTFKAFQGAPIMKLGGAALLVSCTPDRCRNSSRDKNSNRDKSRASIWHICPASRKAFLLFFYRVVLDWFQPIAWFVYYKL